MRPSQIGGTRERIKDCLDDNTGGGAYFVQLGYFPQR